MLIGPDTTFISMGSVLVLGTNTTFFRMEIFLRKGSVRQLGSDSTSIRKCLPGDLCVLWGVVCWVPWG